jgi:hypothetical protein
LEIKDEVEQTKLEKIIKEDILKMEKEFRLLEGDSMTISKLRELISEEI